MSIAMVHFCVTHSFRMLLVTLNSKLGLMIWHTNVWVGKMEIQEGCLTKFLQSVNW